MKTGTEGKKETPIYILPEQSNQIQLPTKLQSVQLQTDLTHKASFIVPNSQPICQAVQTSCQPLHSEDVKTVSVQTCSGFQKPLCITAQSAGEKISMGIQAIVLVPPLPPVQPCVAETQTVEFAVNSIVPKTRPVAKMSKGTQKSPIKNVRKRRNVTKSSSSSQTHQSPRPKKPLLPLKTVQHERPAASFGTPELWNVNILSPPHAYEEKKEPEHSSADFASSMEEILNSMSTQTDLSCLLDQLLPVTQHHSQTEMLELHNSQTQTLMDGCTQIGSDGIHNSDRRILQSDSSSFPLYQQHDEITTMQTSSQTCPQEFQDQATWTAAERVLSSHTQTPSVDKYSLSVSAYSRQSKETQYCSSKINVFQNQIIQTEAFQNFGMGYQEQTTQTQPNFHSIHSQTSQIDKHTLPAPELITANQENTLDMHSSDVLNTRLLAFDYEEQNMETTDVFGLNSLSCQGSVNQKSHYCSGMKNTATATSAHNQTQTSNSGFTSVQQNHISCLSTDNSMFMSQIRDYPAKANVNSRFSQTSAPLTEQPDNAMHSGLDLFLDMNVEDVKNTEMPERRLTESLSSILLGALNDPCHSDTSLTSQDQGLDSMSSGSYTASQTINFDEGMSRGLERIQYQNDTLSTQRQGKSVAGQTEPENFELIAATDEFDRETAWRAQNDPALNIGTQTLEDFVFEAGTQTIADTASSQTTDDEGLVMRMQNIAGMSWESSLEMGTSAINAPHTLHYLGLEMGTQTVSDLSWKTASQTDVSLEMGTQSRPDTTAPHSTIEMSWQTVSQTENSQDSEAGTQTLAEMVSQIGDDCNFEMQRQTLTWEASSQMINDIGLEMGTQTTDDAPALQRLEDMGLDIGTQSLADCSWATSQQTIDGFGLEMGTQTMTNISILQTNDDLGSEMGTQTMTDFSALQSESDLSLDVGAQQMARVNWDTALPGSEMGTQTMTDFSALQSESDLSLDVGAQQMAGVNWDTALPGSEMGTQTMTDFSALQSENDLSLDVGAQQMAGVNWDTALPGSEIGTQTMGAVTWETSQQTADDLSLEMGTQTSADMMTTMEVVDDLGLDMGTQTLHQMITDSHTQTDQTRQWYDDVVTQTEEDLLEFLTRETQSTQTGDDLLEFLTRESQTQTNLCGDERAVQTGDDLLEFFTAATQTQVMEAFNTSAATMNHIGVETGDDLLEFLTRETETQTQTHTT